MEAIGFENFDGIVWRGLTTSLCSWGDSTMAWDSSRVRGSIPNNRLGDTLLVCQRPDNSVKVGSFVLQEQSIGECSCYCTLP